MQNRKNSRFRSELKYFGPLLKSVKYVPLVFEASGGMGPTAAAPPARGVAARSCGRLEARLRLPRPRARGPRSLAPDRFHASTLHASRGQAAGGAGQPVEPE